MDQVDLRHIEHQLLAWRETLEQQSQPARQRREPGAEAPEESAAGASLQELWRRAARVQTREIDRALERIQSGVFGCCERCGQPISAKRLEVIPWARRCFPCQGAGLEARSSLTRYLRAADRRWYSAS